MRRRRRANHVSSWCGNQWQTARGIHVARQPGPGRPSARPWRHRGRTSSFSAAAHENGACYLSRVVENDRSGDHSNVLLWRDEMICPISAIMRPEIWRQCRDAIMASAYIFINEMAAWPYRAEMLMALYNAAGRNANSLSSSIRRRAHRPAAFFVRQSSRRTGTPSARENENALPREMSVCQWAAGRA